MFQIKKLIENFEAYISSSNLLSSKEILLLDEQERLPLEQIKFVQDWGYMKYMLPENLGGKLKSLEELYQLSYSLSKKDLTTAISLGVAMLAALPILIGGSTEQQQELAAKLLGGDIGCLALTEEEHGSDLAANQVQAILTEDYWLISGMKWCINYASRARWCTLLARTNQGGGALGFSIFFIDKTKASGIKPHNKISSLGVRGLDLSGLRFSNTKLSPKALVGHKNRGLELCYKSLQVSRVLCTSFSLGAADTALRLCLKFSLERQLYKSKAFDIPVVKQRLARCFVSLVIADCLGLIVVRACSFYPENLSLWSAIVKFLLPNLAENIIADCSLILGARGYLREGSFALFQKMKRDNEVIGLFDGSSEVNLSLITSQLVQQAKLRKDKTQQIDQDKLNKLFDLNFISPDFKGEGLSLANKGLDPIISGLYLMINEHKLVSHFIKHLQNLDDDIITRQSNKVFERLGLEEFRLAEKYCWVFAASCILHTWFYNRENIPKSLRKPECIQAFLEFILTKIDSSFSEIDSSLLNSMAEILQKFYNENLKFSLSS